MSITFEVSKDNKFISFKLVQPKNIYFIFFIKKVLNEIKSNFIIFSHPENI